MHLKTILEFGEKENPPCNSEDNLHAGLLVIESQVQGLLRESWTKGSSSVWPVIHWAGLMGYEDMKAEDYTRVRIGLSFAWKASLAIRICRSPTIVTDSV